jgi:hypothetical protein
LKHRTLIGVSLVIVVVAFVAALVYVPIEPVQGICFGGSACVHEVSLSCAAFGFGEIINYYGYRSFTYDCAGFLKPTLSLATAG